MRLARRALRLIGRENRGRVLLLIPLALVMSGIEVLGAALVYSLLSLATGATSTLEIPVIGDIRGLFDVDESTLLVGVAAGMGAFFLFRAVMKIGHTYVEGRIVLNMGARLSARLNAGYLAMPYSFHLQRNSSDLIRNANQVVREVFGQAIKPIVRVSAEVVLTLGLLGLLIRVSPLATGLAILIIGFTSLVLLRFIRPRVKRLGRRRHHLAGETLKNLQQSYHGIRDVKILAGEHAFARRYARDQRSLARIAYTRSALSALPSSLIDLAMMGFILVYFVAMVLADRNTPETLAVLGLFAYAGQRLQKSTEGIIQGINDLQYANAPIDQLYGDLELIQAHAWANPVVDPLDFDHEIAIEDVVFRYEGAHSNALDHVTLHIPRGQVVGICGPTGGGKTTLTDVLTGLLPPTSGAVKVDGLDIAGRERDWQARLGVVPQMVFLIDGTLRENIALAQLPGDVDEEAVQEAVDLAQLREFVESLPAGLDTQVGERGVRVSGGQRQRVAIARALYRRPSVLIFDEGTSALDNVTEREVMNALARLRGDHTIVLVAHRLSTVRGADQIVLIQQGKIVAAGSYDDLMETSEDFVRLTAS